jgi:shikimate kinase
MKKVLYLLVGLKGAGKSHIGRLLDRHTDAVFIRVEPIWVEHLNSGRTDKTGWQVVEEEIDRRFADSDRILIETLGAGDDFKRFHASLSSKYEIKMIKIAADLSTCMHRVRTRDQIDHIPISDSRVEEINQIVAGIEYDWDLVIDNNGPAADQDILSAFKKILEPSE